MPKARSACLCAGASASLGRQLVIFGSYPFRRPHAILHALVDEVSLGLEGVQLRRRELDALRRSQVLRYKADLKALLSGLLENILSALDADFAILVVPQMGSFQSRIDLVIGDFHLLPARLSMALSRGS